MVIPLVILATSSLPVARGDDYAISELKSHLGLEYEKLRAHGNTYQDEYSERVYRTIDKKETLESVTTYKRRARPDGYYLLESTLAEPSRQGGVKSSFAADRVMCFSPRYDFQLSAERSGQWILDRCAILGSPEHSAAELKAHDNAVTAAPYDAHYRSGINVLLTHFLANPNVKVASVTRSAANDGCVRIAYNAAGEDLMPGGKMSLTVSGWVDLNPRLNWSVVESQQTTKLPVGEANTTHRFTVQKTDDVVLVIKQEQLTISKVEGKELTSRIVYEFNPRFAPDVDPSEFSLTHYGLPEPVGIAPPPAKPMPRYLWFLIAAGVLAAIAFFSRWLIARRDRATPSPTPA